MFKRIMLTLTFIAAFSTVGIGLSNSASAWRGYYGRPYGAFYGGPRAYYGGYVPYRAYYAPRVFSRPVYAAYPYDYGYPVPYAPYAYPGSYYYAPQPGVSVSFGF